MEDNKPFKYIEVHLFPEEQIGLHENDLWELIYVRQGQGTRIIADKVTPFKAGEVTLIPPHVPNWYQYNKEDTDKEGKICSFSAFFSADFLYRCSDTFPELKERIEKFMQLDSAIEFEKKLSQRICSVLLSMRGMYDLQRLSQIVHLVVLM